MNMKKNLIASSIALALGTSGTQAALVPNIGESSTVTNAAPVANTIRSGYTYTTNSANFTMMTGEGFTADGGASTDGGSNSVVITWDGDAYNSSSDYTGPGSVANVTATATYPFFGHNWTAHDIQVFVPGTYSFDTTLGGGAAEVGMMNVTVPAGTLGMHMLFDWNGVNNIDVFIILDNSMYGAGVKRSASNLIACRGGQPYIAPTPSSAGQPYIAGIQNCLFNADTVTGKVPGQNQVWMFATLDGNADGIMGIPMTTGGPFAGFNAGFNMTFDADTTAPTIALNTGDDSIGTSDADWVDAGATVTDNKDADKTIYGTGTVNKAVPGNYDITYSTTDAAGIAATNNGLTRTVTVFDNTPPVITNTIASQSISACATYGATEARIGVSATDNVSTIPTSSITVGGLPADTCVDGQYTITYNVSDSASPTPNAALQKTRTLNIVLGSPPVITVNPTSVTINEDIVFVEADARTGVSAIDPDGSIDLTSSITLSGWNFDTATPGTFTVYYDVVDGSGATATQESRTYNISDITAPTLSLNTGNDNVGTSDPAWVDAGATVTDNYDATRTITGSGTVNQALPGTYNITYSTTDLAGNAASNNGLSRPVTVFDNTVPVITLTGGNVSVAGGSTYTDPGYSASDNVDGDITNNVVVGGTVNTAVPGTYPLTYNVQDQANNNAIQRTRTVTVTNGQPPVISLYGNASVSLNVGDTYTEAGASATDAEDGTLNPASIVIAGTVDTATEGTYTITYNVNDSVGNPATEVTRTVTVYAASIVVTPTPPVMTASQGGNDSRVIITGDGNVTVSLDQSASTYDWSASDVSASITDAATFTFDPSSLTAGLYAITVTVNAGTNDESTANLLLRVLTSAPALTTADTDGDGVDDVTEGVGDSDGDGISDYLDNSALTARQLGAGNNGTITASAGTLRLGTTAFGSGAVSGLISSSDVNSFGGQGASSVTNGTDAGAITPCVGGCFDFEVTGLTQGQTIQVVLPLSAGIPEIAAYRIYTPADGWHDFVVNGDDAIASSGLVNGNCPSALASGRWVDGLFPGDRCVRLTIQDGGPNDTDGLANGVVSDPSGMAEVPTTVVINKAEGCSMTIAENQASDHADWWLVTAFLSMLGWFGIKRRKA